MAANLHIVRHGKPIAPPGFVYGNNVPLSEEGREQIGLTGEQLRSRGVDLSTIFTSPRPRARESAIALQEIFPQAEAFTLDDLRGADTTSIDGVPNAEIDALSEDFFRHPKYQGEPREIVSERAIQIFQQIERVQRQRPERHIGIVTHSDMIFFILQSLGLPEVSVETGGAVSLRLNEKGRLLEHEVIAPYDIPNRGKERE